MGLKQINDDFGHQAGRYRQETLAGKIKKSPGKDFSRNYRPKNWISNRPVNMAPIVAINPGIMNE